MHGGHDEAGAVGADGDQTKIKRAAELADGCEGGAVREFELGRVVVDVGGKFGYASIAGVPLPGRCLSVIAQQYRLGEGVGVKESYPPNQIFFPPLSTLQELHRVWDLSNGVRALAC